MDMLSWHHWKREMKEFVDGFTCSKELEMSSVLDVYQKRPTSSKWDMSLIFVPSAGSPQMSEEVLNQLCELLPKVSRDWRYQISSAQRDSKRMVLTLSRSGVCIGAIQTITIMSTEERKKMPVTVYLDSSERPLADHSTLTAERQLLACDVIGRLLRWAGHTVTVAGGDGDGPPPAAPGRTSALVCVSGHARLQLPGGAGTEEAGPREGGDGDGTRRVTGREAPCEEESRAARVVVEPVVNMQTGKKELEVTSAEFRRQRCAALLSAGRSRERGCTPERAARLAAASVAHQLLAVSLGSPCRLDTEPDEAASPADGAVFALYNAARLQAVLDRFDEEVAAGTYPPLPSVAELGHHFSRLSTEDEWQLVWRHLLPFPCLLDSCAEGALSGRPALHRLCCGLVALSHTFSRYYSRTHVLTPPLEHLVSTLHVRIHLLKAVRTVFATYFELLGYEPLQRM